MIKSVTATNYLGETVKITLADGEPEHGLLITSIDGLGPAKANINTTAISTSDGSKFNSARLDERNIVIQFLFMEDVETTRQNTYAFFPIKKPVELIFETDNVVLSTTGYVETNEPNIFSDKEGTQISIICPDPYFYSAYSDIIVVSTNRGTFEFPFSSEISLDENFEALLDSIEDAILDSDDEPLIAANTKLDVENSPMIEFGIADENPYTTLEYYGTVPIGVIIVLYFKAEVTHNIILYNGATNQRMILEIDKIHSIINRYPNLGDEIIIDSRINQKTATYRKDTTDTNILHSITRPIPWINIVPGYNPFYYQTDRSDMDSMDMSVYYDTAYEGV